MEGEPVKPHLMAISIIAVVSVVLIGVVYGSGMLGSSSPSVAITGVSPANHSLISNARPVVGLNLSLQNVKTDALSYALFVDGGNATGGVSIATNGIQFVLPGDLSQGVHYARVNVSLGQTILASSSWDFSIDVSAPGLTGLNPANGTTHGGDGLVVSANFTDLSGLDLDRFGLLLDGNDITDHCLKSNSGFSYTPASTLSEGTHLFSLELYDVLGNTASYSWSLVIRYPVMDSFPPYLIAAYPANGSLVNSSNPAVWFHINDTLSGVDVNSSIVKVDNIPVAFSYTGSHLDGWTVRCTPFLTDNNHTAMIYFKDFNNNSKIEQIGFLVDSTPPTIGGITPPNGSSLSSSSVQISAHFMDLLSGVNASAITLIVDSLYNPASAIINSSDVSYSAQLMNGSHYVTIRVSDLAGNIARASWSFTVNLPSNNSKPTGSVMVLTKTGYFNTESGLPTIVGEVKNNGSATVKNVLVKGLFMCKDGGVINNDKKDPAIIYGYPEIAVLEPGDVAPFKLEMPTSFPDFAYILSQLAKFDAIIDGFTVTSDVPYKSFAFANVTATLQPDRHYSLAGIITNTGSTTISDVKVVGTFYTDAKPIAVESAHVYSLEPGESASFTLLVDDNVVGPLINRYDLKASA